MIVHGILSPKLQMYGLEAALSHDLLFKKLYSTSICGVVKTIDCDVPQSLVLRAEALKYDKSIFVISNLFMVWNEVTNCYGGIIISNFPTVGLL